MSLAACVCVWNSNGLSREKMKANGVRYEWGRGSHWNVETFRIQGVGNFKGFKRYILKIYLKKSQKPKKSYLKFIIVTIPIVKKIILESSRSRIREIFY